MRKIVLSLLAIALLATLPAGASTFLAMSQDELVHQSDAVVVGKVLEVESFRDESGRVIVSEAMIEVEETVVGTAPSIAVVRTLGGTVDGYTVVAHGFPAFEPEDRVVVFLEEQQDGSSRVVGYRLGQYKVITNRHGVDIAVPTLEPGVRLLTATGEAAPRPRPVPLDTLRSQLRQRSQRLHREQGF